MVIEPLEFIEKLWPDYYLYGKQRDIAESFEYNKITVVPSANKMGKDFIASLCVVSKFLRYKECRIISTSIRDDHLRVLFGEIDRHIVNCRFPLLHPLGPLKVKHRDIRKYVNGKLCPISYVRGLVSERPEGFAGHHARHTSAVFDESSGVDDSVLEQTLTWAQHVLIIGNPLQTTNFFFRMVKNGDKLAQEL